MACGHRFLRRLELTLNALQFLTSRFIRLLSRLQSRFFGRQFTGTVGQQFLMNQHFLLVTGDSRFYFMNTITQFLQFFVRIPQLLGQHIFFPFEPGFFFLSFRI